MEIRLIVGCLLGLLAAGCGGGGGTDASAVQGWNPPPPPPPAVGTGTLAVRVIDPDGRAMSGVLVSAFGAAATAGTGVTGADGSATLRSLPPSVRASAFSEFGYASDTNVPVAQQGTTSITLALAPYRPRPTVALLPVDIPGDRIAPDRSALTLRITVVALAAATFNPPEGSTTELRPSLFVELGDDADYSPNACWWWLDPLGNSNCARYSGSPAHTVATEAYVLDAPGTVPFPSPAGTPRSALLVLDQSRRVSALDPNAIRTFAARRFVERIVRAPDAVSLAVGGIAASDSNVSLPLVLPQQPLWLSSGAAGFSSDESTLKSALDVLEPLVGGSANVFTGLAAAISQTNSSAPPGTRTVVALVGGDDSSAASPSTRADTLAALRNQRDASGVRVVLIDASAAQSATDHRSVADLAAALRAPMISFGVARNSRDFYTQSWASGSTAALELAGDLVAGNSLPTLTLTLRVTDRAGAFPQGKTLRGVLYLFSDICPMGCWELPIAFTAFVP